MSRAGAEAAGDHDPLHRHVRVSDILSGVKARMGKSDVTLGELFDAFGERSFGAGLLLFSLPSTLMLSALPGVSSLFAVPIALLAVQWLFGAGKPWLPKRLRAHRLPKKLVPKLIGGAEKALAWIERYRLLKPRWSWVSARSAQRLSAGTILFAAFILFLPIPFGNFPPGLAVTLIALGTIERDGIVIVLGNLLGLVTGVLLLAALSFGVGHSLESLFG